MSVKNLIYVLVGVQLVFAASIGEDLKKDSSVQLGLISKERCNQDEKQPKSLDDKIKYTNGHFSEILKLALETPGLPIRRTTAQKQYPDIKDEAQIDKGTYDVNKNVGDQDDKSQEKLVLTTQKSEDGGATTTAPNDSNMSEVVVSQNPPSFSPEGNVQNFLNSDPQNTYKNTFTSPSIEKTSNVIVSPDPPHVSSSYDPSNESNDNSDVTNGSANLQGFLKVIEVPPSPIQNNGNSPVAPTNNPGYTQPMPQFYPQPNINGNYGYFNMNNQPGNKQTNVQNGRYFQPGYLGAGYGYYPQVSAGTGFQTNGYYQQGNVGAGYGYYPQKNINFQTNGYYQQGNVGAGYGYYPQKNMNFQTNGYYQQGNLGAGYGYYPQQNIGTGFQTNGYYPQGVAGSNYGSNGYFPQGNLGFGFRGNGYSPSANSGAGFGSNGHSTIGILGANSQGNTYYDPSQQNNMYHTSLSNK